MSSKVNLVKAMKTYKASQMMLMLEMRELLNSKTKLLNTRMRELDLKKRLKPRDLDLRRK